MLVDADDGLSPPQRSAMRSSRSTPRGRKADGIVVTPSQPSDRRWLLAQSRPTAAPADTAITGWIQNRANDLLRRTRRASGGSCCHGHARRFRASTSSPTTLRTCLDPDIDAIRSAGVHRRGSAGGASVAYWAAIAERLRLTSTWSIREPTRSCVHDPRLGRQDPDGLLVAVCDGLAGCGHATRHQVATGNDATPTATASTPDAGLMNLKPPTCPWVIDYLLSHRDGWSPQAGVGKTLVSCR